MKKFVLLCGCFLALQSGVAVAATGGQCLDAVYVFAKQYYQYHDLPIPDNVMDARISPPFLKGLNADLHSDLIHILQNRGIRVSNSYSHEYDPFWDCTHASNIKTWRTFSQEIFDCQPL